MRKNIWIACLIIMALDFILTVLDLLYVEQPFEFTYLNWALGILGNILITFLSVLMINAVQESESKKTVLGFFWRGMIVSTLSIYVAAILMIFLRIQFEIPSIQHTIGVTLLSLLSIIFLSWLFFSSNRKGQLLWVQQLF